MTAPAFNTATTFNRISHKLLPVFTGKLLPILFLTIIMVLYSRRLSYYDYGQFQTVWLYSNIIGVIINFGLSTIILSTGYDHFSQFIRLNRLRVLLLYFIGAIITFGIFYFTTGHLSSHTKLLLVGFIILQSACTLTDSMLIKHNRLSLYLWINIIYSLFFFVIHLYFFYTQFVLNQLILGIICLSALKASVIFLAVTEKRTPVTTTLPVKFVTNWLFVGTNEIAGIIARWLDKLFLLYLLSPGEFAIFFNGAFEIPLFGILISAMENIMLTSISADISNRRAAEHIFKESFKLLSLIAFPIFFFLLTMHAEAFSIIFKNKYEASVPIFLISIFIIPIRITHYGVILQCYGQSKKIAFGSLMDIGLSLLLMFILYPLSGMPGVALAIVISTYLQAGYYLWQSSKLMRVSIKELVPLFFLLKLWLSLAAFYGGLYFVKDLCSPAVSLISVFVFTSITIIGGLMIYRRKNLLVKR